MDDVSESLSATPPLAALPPIFTLYHDILLHIFHLNTYTPETEYTIYALHYSSNSISSSSSSSPLNTAHHTSQVCHSWRHLILGSPAIWGSILDVTVLETSSGLWVDEVLKRTGEADLSIYGWIGYRSGSTAFFTYLLDCLWHRVRRFDVTLDNHLWIEDKALNIMFGKPAPRLETFRLTNGDGNADWDWGGGGGGDEPLGKNKGPLFANFAPALRRFHCTMLLLDRRSAWLGDQLQSLTLSDPLTGSTSNVLSILGTTGRLESVIVKNTPSSLSLIPDGGWTRMGTKMSLPHLIRLHIVGTVSQCLFYLQIIVAHPDCALVLDIKDYSGDVSVDQLDLFVNAITPYIARYFTIHRPPRLNIYMGSSSFKLHAIKSTDMMYFAHPETRFSISIRTRSPDSRCPFIDSLLSALSSLPLGCVVELEFIKNAPFLVDPCPTPGLLGLITALSSVRTLIVPPQTLKLLNHPRMHSTSASAFPLLIVIRLDAPSGSHGKISRQDLLRFFSQRKVLCVPVQTLDISDVWISHGRFDWRFLDAMGGLKVKWKRNGEEVEYVCGSGGQRMLNWNVSGRGS